MNDSRNYAIAETPRANRPASSAASNLNQRILEAIDRAADSFLPNQLEMDGVSILDISGHMRALINLKLIEVEIRAGTERFALTPAGKAALENRLLAID